jgi:hypothetical protein
LIVNDEPSHSGNRKRGDHKRHDQHHAHSVKVKRRQELQAT